MAAHRYWRVASRNRTDSQYMYCTELVLRSTSGGANLVGSGTPISSSNFSGTFDAPKAFDGNTSTYWSSISTDQTTNQWIGYDFGVGVTHDVVEIQYTSTAANLGRAPIAFDVQWSDDNVTWTTEWSVITTTWTATLTRTFTKPVAAGPDHRYWSLWFEKAQDFGSFVSGAECELRNVSSGSDLTGSGTPGASGSFSGFPIASLFDNNNSTAWANNDKGAITETNPHYVTYDFGSGNAYNIVEFAWRSRSDNYPNQGPVIVKAKWSDDGVNYMPTPGISVAPATWVGSSQLQVFTIPATADSNLEVSLAETSAVLTYATDLEVSLLEASVLQTGEESQLEVSSLQTDLMTDITIEQNTAVVDDIWYPKVDSLLHFAEADGSTTTVDMRPHYWFFRGGAVVSTTEKKFGTASLRLAPSSNGYLECGDFSLGAYGQRDYTVEAWIRLDSLGKMHTIAQNRGTSPYGGFLFSVTSGNKLSLQLYNNSASAFVSLTGATNLVAGTWHHVAFVKSANWHAIYLDGVSQGTSLVANYQSNKNVPLLIGRDTATGASGDFNGYIDEFRVTANYVRYPVAFTAPTAAFADDGVPVPPPIGFFGSSLDAQYAYSVDSALNVSNLDAQYAYTVDSGYNISALEVQIVYSVRTIPEPRIHFQVLRY